NRHRVDSRRRAWEQGAWVREAAACHASKQAARQAGRQGERQE
ncbi:1,2-phenylacetyl-CoA epoxidase subunit A, partial [Pseudomonas sp. MWU12-2534b]